MPNASVDFTAILRLLIEHRIEFIVVGGVCAVLNGAPLRTFDLDVVHSRTPENISRLLAALDDLDAHYRGVGDRRLKPDAEHLASSGHQLLITRLGPLDILGTIGADHDYADLLKHSVEYEVSGLRLCVLDLETLIRVKEEVGFEKDMAALPILRRTLEEQKKKKNTSSSA